MRPADPGDNFVELLGGLLRTLKSCMYPYNGLARCTHRLEEQSHTLLVCVNLYRDLQQRVEHVGVRIDQL